MTDRVKIIRMLDELRQYADYEIHPLVSPDNWDVYCRLRDMVDETENNILNLLKAQEPRLLDLSELTTVDDILWLEVKDRYLACAQLEFDFTTSYYLFSVMGDEEMVKELQCDYGKTWRCWTSQPTDEQRKKEPWNEH